MSIRMSESNFRKVNKFLNPDFDLEKEEELRKIFNVYREIGVSYNDKRDIESIFPRPVTNTKKFLRRLLDFFKQMAYKIYRPSQ